MNLLLNSNKFIEEFVECVIILLLNFFLSYDLVELYLNLRNIIAFYTLLGLIRQCTLLIDTTNLVAKFVQIIRKICLNYVHTRCLLYLDNMCIKGPKS